MKCKVCNKDNIHSKRDGHDGICYGCKDKIEAEDYDKWKEDQKNINQSETLSSKIVLCQDITGSCLEAISKEDVMKFIKKLKDISVDCGEGQCDANMQLREALNEMVGDALEKEGEQSGS